MRTENFPKLKRSDHSPKRDEFIDVSSDPPYFSLDSPFKVEDRAHCWLITLYSWPTSTPKLAQHVAVNTVLLLLWPRRMLASRSSRRMKGITAYAVWCCTALV
jgi:hypothetical protein